MPAPDARSRGTALPAVVVTALILLAGIAAGFRGTWSADPAPVSTPGPGPTPPPIPVETASVDPGEPPPVQESTPLEPPAWPEGAVTVLAVLLLIGLAVQQRHLSLYVNAVDDGEYLVRRVAATLGRVTVGAAAVTFTSVEALEADGLRGMLATVALQHPEFAAR